MSEWRPIQIGAKSYQPRSGTQSIERLVNLYPEASAPGAKTPVTLYGTPGLLAWTTVGDGPIRGIHYARGYFWVVSGTRLYAVNAGTKAITNIGVVAGVGPVRMINDATYVVVCAQTFSYAATLTSIVVLPEEDLVGAAYQDGYGLYVQRNTQFMWLSGLDDLTTIGATAFTSADVKSDNVVAVISDQREVWVFKQQTTEVYYNSGNSTFAFERVGGGFIERGCASPGSVAAAETFVFWLGDDLKVYRAAGYNPEAISTPDIERLISNAISPETSEAFTYAQAGHTFYVLTCADLTLCYDLTTNRWHERKSFGLSRWRAHGHAVSGQLQIVGDYSTNELYEIDLDTYTDSGDLIERIAIDPPLSADPRPLFIHELHLDFEAGVGLTSGQGVAPEVLLSWSEDDGRTWSSDRAGSLGALGVYRKRARFTRLGRSYNRSHRWRISDPVKIAILGAAARVDLGAA